MSKLVREIKTSVTAEGWAKKYDVTANIDFTGMTVDELIEAALPAVLIDFRSGVKKRGESFAANLGNVVIMIHAKSPRSFVADNELVDFMVELGTVADKAAGLAALKKDPALRGRIMAAIARVRG